MKVVFPEPVGGGGVNITIRGVERASTTYQPFPRKR